MQYYFKKYFSILSIFFIGYQNLKAQDISASITEWYNNAQGAYTICHDDYCDWSVDGIRDYADTIASNRGLRFTFGAITGDCETRPGYYDLASKMMKNHGHELITHTHTHSCAVYNQDCGGEGPFYGWAEPGRIRFDIEMDRATQSIYTNTGLYPRFFIYPYDIFNDASEKHLHKLNYYGSRTGDYDSMNDSDFAPDSVGFFHTAVVVDVVETDSAAWAQNLNNWIDTAIIQKGWVFRELHNVGPQGWGHVEISDYQNHLDYVKSKVDSGEIWMATVSEVLSYQIQKLSFDTTYSTYDDKKNQITLSWNKPKFPLLASYLDSFAFKTPVTIQVYLDSIPFDSISIVQGNEIITEYTYNDTLIQFSVYPHRGDVILKEAEKATASINPIKNNLDVLISSNPFEENCHVSIITKVPDDHFYISLTDLTGKPMMDVSSTNDKEFDIGKNLAKGIYILSIQGMNGMGTYKLIKQ